MRLQVVAYPPYRAGLGAGTLDLDVQDDSTLRDVLRQLADRSREFEPLAGAAKDEWLWGQLLVHSKGEMVRLNCEALTVLSNHFVKQMLARKSGGVLHVASVAAFQPAPWMAVYAASKAYVLSFSEALSEELRGTGVRCSALCPGPVQTGFQTAAGAQIAASQKRSILSAAETVARGLHAYQRNKAVFVPGGMNRLGTFGSWLLPRKLVVRAVGKVMRGKKLASPANG